MMINMAGLNYCVRGKLVRAVIFCRQDGLQLSGASLVNMLVFR